VRTVNTWTGREARALRLALRFSVRGFAEHLGVGIRTVSKWEANGGVRRPQPAMQAALDTVLARAAAEEQARFDELTASSTQLQRGRAAARTWSKDDWIDDLDRARLGASQQNFSIASILAGRWLARTDSVHLDDEDLHLRGRTLMLLGDVARDQGRLSGPCSAVSAYRQALRAFGGARAERRTAQVELLLTVILEMSGELERSAQRYQELAVDPRLSALDQARARLWIGTALTKVPASAGIDKVAAVGAIESAICGFEDLDEPDEWNVGHQKLALAHLALERRDDAHRHIDIAQSGGASGTPLQRVKLDTARGHILVSDRSTRSEGLLTLARCRDLAGAHHLLHQVASIDRIIGSLQDQADPRKVS
jgi:transcriptional regulator with XRE-family HTH domain